MTFKEAIENIGYEKEYSIINETDRLVCVKFCETRGEILVEALELMFPLIDKLLEYGFVFMAVGTDSNYWYFRKEKVDPRVASNFTMKEWIKEEIKPVVADSTQGMRRGE